MKSFSDFEEDISLLWESIEEDSGDKSCIKRYCQHPILKIHEGMSVLYALLCKKNHQECLFPKLDITSTGMVLLFSRACFPWKGLPYPYEHARLGLWLLKSSDGNQEFFQIAKRMLAFQKATLDHFGKTLSGLFRQYQGPSLTLTTQATYDLLESFTESFHPSYDFSDDEVGYHLFRRENTTVAIAASGCKSGMGVFLRGEAGVICYGPHSPPFESGTSFGLAGRHHNYCCEKKEKDLLEISYICRIAAPNQRNTGIDYLEDSSENVPWIQTHCFISPDKIHHECQFFFPVTLPMNRKRDLAFSFFGKGCRCRIFEGPFLRAGALDAYRGPAQKIIFEGPNSEEVILEGFAHAFMEVISLAGDDTFWGADFLVIFHPNFEDNFSFSFA